MELVRSTLLAFNEGDIGSELAVCDASAQVAGGKIAGFTTYTDRALAKADAGWEH